MKLTRENLRLEAGLDEAGRGCLAGPVVAAAVILDPNKDWSAINDSKKLTHKKRIVLKDYIEKNALCYGVGIVSHIEIDEINILNASFLAMHRAVEKLNSLPELLNVDGNRFTAFKGIPHVCSVKGDARFRNIAAASILAKTERDQIMREAHNNFPVYGWEKNKGYPTKNHREAIKKYGISQLHRKSFKLLPKPE